MKFFDRKNRFLEALIILLLLALTFTLYLTLSNKGAKGIRIASYRAGDEIHDGLNHYRLDNLDRAAASFHEVLEKERSRRVKSLAALYLGNIQQKRGNYDGAIEYYRQSLSLDRRNVHALYNTALVQLKKGMYSRALQSALNALRESEGYAPALLLAGDIYRALGKYSEALSLYERGGEDKGIFQYNRAMVHVVLREQDKAEMLLEAVIAGRDNSRSLKGLSYVRLGFLQQGKKRGEAVENLLSALNTFPNSIYLRFDCSLLLMKESRFDEALPFIESLEGATPTEKVGALMGLGLFKTGAYAEAAKLYLGEYRESGNPETAAILGDISVILNDLDGAKKYYRSSLERSAPAEETSHPDAYHGGKNAFLNLTLLMIGEGEYEDALAACAAYEAHFPQDCLTYIVEAELFFKQGFKDLAKDALLQATDIAGEDAFSLLRIATLYRENGLYNNALHIYQKVISSNRANTLESNTLALVGMAKTYARAGHIDKATKSLERARQSTSDISLYYAISLNLAYNLEARGAIYIYEELIKDFPYRYEASHNLALLYVRLGEYEKGVQVVGDCLIRNRELSNGIRSHLYAILGAAHEGLGDLEAASEAFLRARELDRNNAIPLIHLKNIEQARESR